jgi:LPS export ABC transporter protein LptC
MKFNRRTWIIIGLTSLAVLSILTAIMTVFYNKAPQTILKVMADHVDLQVKNVIYTDVGQSGEKWEIKAETARYIKKENLALFDHVRVRLLTAEGKTFTLTGDKGRFKTDQKDIDIYGNVEGTSDSGERFTTDLLRYNNAEGKIYTDSAVTLGSGRIKITGTGMTMNVKSGELSLLSQVKADIKAK